MDSLPLSSLTHAQFQLVHCRFTRPIEAVNPDLNQSDLGILESLYPFKMTASMGLILLLFYVHECILLTTGSTLFTVIK